MKEAQVSHQLALDISVCLDSAEGIIASCRDRKVLGRKAADGWIKYGRKLNRKLMKVLEDQERAAWVRESQRRLPSAAVPGRSPYP